MNVRSAITKRLRICVW